MYYLFINLSLPCPLLPYLYGENGGEGWATCLLTLLADRPGKPWKEVFNVAIQRQSFVRRDIVGK